MLALHQGSGECFLSRIVISHIQETCGFLIFFKETLSTNQYEDNISRTVNLGKSMEIYHIFQQSHRQIKILDN